jgi:hypothetical protein
MNLLMQLRKVCDQYVPPQILHVGVAEPARAALTCFPTPSRSRTSSASTSLPRRASSSRLTRSSRKFCPKAIVCSYSQYALPSLCTTALIVFLAMDIVSIELLPRRLLAVVLMLFQHA